MVFVLFVHTKVPLGGISRQLTLRDLMGLRGDGDVCRSGVQLQRGAGLAWRLCALTRGLVRNAWSCAVRRNILCCRGLAST
jgi:hypothetical protein